MDEGAAVDLYWLPLGAGGSFVRLNGRLFEAVAARLARRRPCELYHSALEVRVPEGRFVIEMTPIPDGDGAARGVVAEGSVGARPAGRLRIFRYEVRRWLGGAIPDVDEAVASPRRLTGDPATARRVLELVPQVPTPVWGRDELRTGEMWNSNSLVSWLLARCGVLTESIGPPPGGRAPGWDAGLEIAGRSTDWSGRLPRYRAGMTERPSSTWKTVHLDDLPRMRVGALWRPLRRELGVTGFGINAYTAEAVGDELIEPHDETSAGSGRHEEVYLVVQGTASFRVGETSVDAPPGTFVFVPPGVRREATAASAPATVLVVGGRPGALPVSPFEYWYAAEPAYQAGDFAEAVRIAREGLEAYPEHPHLNYQLACYEARAGHADAAFEYLEIACRDERARTWAADDDDFATLRSDERFARLVTGDS